MNRAQKVLDLLEKAPPGWEENVKHLKKHKKITNPYALAWYQKNRGDTSHLTKKKKKDE
jgi:hypothetical protein